MQLLTGSQLNTIIAGVNAVQHFPMTIGNSLKRVSTFGFDLGDDVSIKVEEVFSYSNEDAFCTHLDVFKEKLKAFERATIDEIDHGKQYENLVIAMLPISTDALVRLGTVARYSRLLKTVVVLVDTDENFMQMSATKGEHKPYHHVNASHLPGEMKGNVFCVSYKMLDDLDSLMQSYSINY